MFILIFGYILAVGIGLSLGLIGGGGSILAVPILVYVMGVGIKEAIAMSLFIVGTVSLVGAIPHWFQGNVNLKIVALFAPAAMLGAYSGARLAALPFITETIQLVCFGVVMIIASVLMISQSRKTPKEDSQKQPPKSHYGLPKWLAIPLEGLGVGVLTGFVGVGGGFAVIPALVLLGGIPMKEAIGTSLLVIALKSVTGFWGYIDQTVLDWTLMLSFTVAASFGTIAGAYLTKNIDSKHLQKGFGYFVLAIAVLVLVKH
ncbi:MULTISPECIES: sulfite exporter TauE/SafE family protein [Spirulina sp. CCY15215]|uniref:sulfite exporter TauE/SafE family protein n=1 Tax=Spirulina sp. CCY15215 TaxID=2767591 RepID=UPI00194E8799|nr:sulfite exporter TauE/SafE family protein [Spirulina major]